MSKRFVSTSTRREYTVVELSRTRTYSNLYPHSPEAGDPYFIGDCYQPTSVSRGWESNSSGQPYLESIKSLSDAWPHLFYLADFMEVGTTPLRWKELVTDKEDQEERISRTNVTVVDVLPTGETAQSSLKTAGDLECWLETTAKIPCGNPKAAKTSIIFVEDLSRSVIEALGSRFHIDPRFFREQIDDYAWYNLRDRWAVPPTLMATGKRRKWFRVRHARPRYFRSEGSFDWAKRETNGFNVLRRPDNDHNHWPYLDAAGSLVAITRTKTCVWINREENGRTICIILVDPTVHQGYPLWYGCANWAFSPDLPSSEYQGPAPRSSLFEIIVRSTLAYLEKGEYHHDGSTDLAMLVNPVLFTVCSEWLVLCDYIKARLGQIEWELEFPEQFRPKGDVIDSSLKKLHTWRRMIPLYREMVTETLEQALPLAHKLMNSEPDPASEFKTEAAYSRPKTLGAVAPDFERVLKTLEELGARTDRLTSVVVAAISIEDSRRGLQENESLSRLTWLASIFIPLTFVTGLFSMQAEIEALRRTFGWYFLTAAPLTALTLLLASRSLGRGYWRIKRKGTGKHHGK